LANRLPSSFRLALPLCASGDFIFEDWTATTYVTGMSVYDFRNANRKLPVGSFNSILEAGRGLHRTLSDVAKPSFIAGRNHPWAIADRVAWDETSLPDYITSDQQVNPVVTSFFKLRKPFETTRQTDQVVHGDLTGNVLLSETEVPAIIDFTPYFRPVHYAEAIVVTDMMIDFNLFAEGIEALKGMENR
jgi:Ser/Thr protein kinase RdoA (MazF antagonist)